jgi:hypothetical protein
MWKRLRRISSAGCPTTDFTISKTRGICLPVYVGTSWESASVVVAVGMQPCKHPEGFGGSSVLSTACRRRPARFVDFFHHLILARMYFHRPGMLIVRAIWRGVSIASVSFVGVHVRVKMSGVGGTAPSLLDSHDTLATPGEMVRELHRRLQTTRSE